MLKKLYCTVISCTIMYIGLRIKRMLCYVNMLCTIWNVRRSLFAWRWPYTDTDYSVILLKPKSHLRDWGPRLSTTEKKSAICGESRSIAGSRELDSVLRECRTYAVRIRTYAVRMPYESIRMQYECSTTAVRLQYDCSRISTYQYDLVRTNTIAVGMRYDLGRFVIKWHPHYFVWQ